MSDCDQSELDDRLLELNNWQVEQQKKLKEFQEVQRKLLDTEHEKILSTLKTQNYDLRHGTSEKDQLLNHYKCSTENGWDTQSKGSNQNCMFQIKSDAIKLKDPKVSLCSVLQLSDSDKSEELCENNNEALEEAGIHKPRTFLKRGDGLARFRMTLDDFKTCPNIYKEKRIKTYLSQKPEASSKKSQSKTNKSINELKKQKPVNAVCKSKMVPVNIYVSDNKSKCVNSARSNCDSKVKAPQTLKKKELLLSKTPMRTLSLKPATTSFYFKNPLDSGKNFKNEERNSEEGKSSEFVENKMKKDERELRLFEILEGKIDDGTFSPNSSLVAKFMEESVSSTPSKVMNGDCDSELSCNYFESLRALQRQYLTQEQINRIDEVNENCMIESVQEQWNKNAENKVEDKYEKLFYDEGGKEVDGGNQNSEKESIHDEIASGNGTTEGLEASVPKKIKVQDIMTSIRKLRGELEDANNFVSDESADSQTEGNTLETENDLKCSQTENDLKYSHREIALKLQRKALQDNVKNLLDWEGISRKKPIKKSVKKVKLKQGKVEKPRKADKSESDKIVFNVSLLKNWLEELEKEIEIFKRENKNFTQLQRECDSEKVKLEKERKEFEKYMTEEREKFQTRIAEEQKKLQREKTVFEKYCKQMKNQPNRKERDEITNLKNEVEKLTELLATKESRWGASQARLRNRVKSLEKENSQLKFENEKLKKQAAKKVSFESTTNLSTKIIHAINSELGKLKPHLVKNGTIAQKNQSLSARVDTNLSKKPMRRIKSVPDLKRTSDKMDATMAVNDPDEINVSPSVISDKSDSSCRSTRINKSGVEARFETNSDVIPLSERYSESGSSTISKPAGNQACENSIVKSVKPGEENKLKFSNVDEMESVLKETLFENNDRGDYNATNGTIAEIKRRLEKLNLLDRSEPVWGEGDRKKTVPFMCETVGCGYSSEESYESEDIINDRQIHLSDGNLCCEKEYDASRRKGGSTVYVNYMLHKKDEDKGVREKTFQDGRKEVYYPNGNIKKISSDSRIVKMLYYNGDSKETDVVEGSEKYYYAETKTWHTTYKDGLEVLEFPSGQTERRHPDGSTEILFPNGCVRYCDRSGKDEWRFVDGTVIKSDKNGEKILLLPNGQKEIHTNEYKKREYPDGTIKLLYPDGTQETRYASGRVRLKDKDGNLVMDSGGIR